MNINVQDKINTTEEEVFQTERKYGTFTHYIIAEGDFRGRFGTSI